VAGGTREIKVGIFVFIAFILLAVVIFSISDFYTAQPHYALRVRFNFANGIQMGAPVRLVGVNVGEVRSVRVYRDETTQRSCAELGIRLSTGALIEEDSVAYINTLGLIGEKYLEIIPGSPGTRVMKEGQILTGKDSIPTEQMVDTTYRIMKKLEETITAIHSVVGDEGTQNAVKGSTERLHQLLEQANEVMAKIRQGEGTIGRLLTQDDLYRDLQAITADIKAHPWKLLYRPKGSK